MKKKNIRSQIITFFENHPGEHKTGEIASFIDASASNVSKALNALAAEGKIQKVKNGTYCRTDAPRISLSSLNADGKQLSKALRAEDANKHTADKLMNLYDKHVEKYTEWFDANVNANIDFEQQLLFIENFKWLTMIGDKLMKRWALEHIGYDTNTRLAQEDAKAKTAEKEKAALKDAPIEEQVNIVGSFDLDTKQLIDNLPNLEDLTEEEQEEIKV